MTTAGQTAEETGRRRAAPLAPSERRAAIVDAVLPLIVEHGPDVTTKELAAAAGVAEGTLFRVFPDKNTLLGEAAITGLLRTAEPTATQRDLASVDRGLPLVERVARIIELGHERIGESAHFMMVLRTLHSRIGDAGPRGRADKTRMNEVRARLIAQYETHRAVIADGLESALAPDADRLRVPLDIAVALIESAIMHGRAGPDRLTPPLPSGVLADAVVHGIVAPHSSSPAPTSDVCLQAAREHFENKES